jgi:hypothetical protein
MNCRIAKRTDVIEHSDWEAGTSPSGETLAVLLNLHKSLNENHEN